MLDHVRQFFFKIMSTRFISETKSVILNFVSISGTSNSLSDCSKNSKKIYRLENFHVNVLMPVRGVSLTN